MKIVALGDSLTAGYLLEPKECWTHLLADKLNLEVVNKGISGDTTAGMLSRFNADVLMEKPDIMILMGGTNDVYFKLDNRLVLSNINSINRQAKHYGIEIIVGLPTPYIAEADKTALDTGLNTSVFEKNISAYRKLLKAYLINDNQRIIDFGENFTKDHLMEDGLHPNALGQTIMMENALKVIEKR